MASLEAWFSLFKSLYLNEIKINKQGKLVKIKHRSETFQSLLRIRHTRHFIIVMFVHRCLLHTISLNEILKDYNFKIDY